MKKEIFIAQGQKRLETVTIPVLCVLSVLALSGCSLTSSSGPAPKPPVSIKAYDMAAQQREPISTVKVSANVWRSHSQKTMIAYNSLSSKGCNVRNRFDRDALMAYEWGDRRRNRLALDVDGIGVDQFDFEAFKLEYKIRLQPELTKEQKCRYASRWQGMLGSGYNEFFLRDSDTVWRELGVIEEDISENLDDLF